MSKPMTITDIFVAEVAADCIAAKRDAIKHFVWLEFTGFLDKHEKEIYEGDILCKRYEDEAEELGYLDDKVPVVFQDGSFGWVWNQSKQFRSFFEDPLADYEVIGNIYENPKLLKQQP